MSREKRNVRTDASPPGTAAKDERVGDGAQKEPGHPRLSRKEADDEAAQETEKEQNVCVKARALRGSP